MKTSELRLGNLVYVTHRSHGVHLPIEMPMKVYQLGIFNSEVLPEETHPETASFIKVANSDLSPIELTAEWLERFGFGVSDEHEMGHNTHKHFGFYYDYHFKRFRLDCDDDSERAEAYLDIHCVHQLQNLYFALVGEELPVNAVATKVK